MSNCTSGCPTQDHASYSECLRGKGTRVAYCNSAAGSDATRQKKWDAEIDAYWNAKRQGIQPEGTSMRQIETAIRLSDATGKPYDAGKPNGGLLT